VLAGKFVSGVLHALHRVHAVVLLETAEMVMPACASFGAPELAGADAMGS
jgi:hypothetical protein